MKMFKMPQPDVRGPTGTGTYFDSYTPEKFKQGLRDALEQAAQMCEGIQNGLVSDHHIACATAIRIMKKEIK